MPTTTVRIPEEMRDALKIIASVEKRNIKDILSELIEEYMERHKETLEILSHPEWVEAIHEGLKALEKGEVVKWPKKALGK
jgi:predicted transcriptional regulator